MGKNRAPEGLMALMDCFEQEIGMMINLKFEFTKYQLSPLTWEIEIKSVKI